MKAHVTVRDANTDIVLRNLVLYNDDKIIFLRAFNWSENNQRFENNRTIIAKYPLPYFKIVIENFEDE